VLARNVIDRTSDGRSVSLGVLRGFCEEVTRELVVTRRNGHRDLGGRATVDLGRSPRPRSAPVVDSPVVDLEQAVGGETIEMVCRHPPPEADGSGRSIPAHPVVLRDHELVERPSVGLREQPEDTEVVTLLVGVGIHRGSRAGPGGNSIAKTHLT
jgi:hypothetical protein